MADYTVTSRTNYFQVKDLDAFRAALKNYGLSTGDFDGYADLVLTQREGGKIALFAYGTWPSLDEDSVFNRLDLDDTDEVPSEHETLHDLVSAHLVDGDVAIFISAGHEKMRYVSGSAVAVNANGESRQLHLEDIYTLAAELTTPDRVIAVAEY